MITIAMAAWLAFAAMPVAAPTAAPAPPVAPSPVASGREAKARRLIDMMHMEHSFDFMFAGLVPIMADGITGVLERDASGKAFIARIDQGGPEGRAKLKAIFAQEFTASIKRRYPAMVDAAAKDYAAAFSERELDDLIAFYGSGAGAKALAMTPQLQQSMAAHGRELGQEAGREAGASALRRAERELLTSPARK